MINVWVKENRLKCASAIAVLGDVCMGTAGAVGIFHPVISQSGDYLLVIGGLVALCGHTAMLIWGKGGEKNYEQKNTLLPTVVTFRIFMPWRYPLDFGFMCFLCAHSCYSTAGFLTGNSALAVLGGFGILASGIGWLWPQARLIFAFRPVQVTALIYLAATLATFIAGFAARSAPLIGAGLCFSAYNLILYTVRKENQSAYSQTHG